ncbi:thioredoxin family protein [Paenibacillus sp. MMS18-CY102]|uniref:thioredoxin family protein n=1 Tax=Paenibacillus sp. MMS18-CY102 TaxID=2682849 RepID=UPI001365C00B|nr:thioredoxin family protein [Paenibacillus sp. MMS18-CY102]MWC27905.1 thioredoxin [Paenibacillus sp. MMS18-CY102]
MGLTERTERELLEDIRTAGGEIGDFMGEGVHGREAVLFYTAMCGTCQVAERMLEVVQATGIPVPVRKINISFAPVLRERWRIASVPCLVLLEGGEPVLFEYTMRSVDHLYTLLKSS